MFNRYYKRKNKKTKIIYDRKNRLAVVCKLNVEEGVITNYLINIKDHNDITTILLDRDGNTMFSQVRL